MMKSKFAKFSKISFLALSIAGFSASVQAQGQINVLGWCDHTDPALLQPFEQATGIKVNTKEYEGTGTALGILRQARPGDWDVLVVDSVDIGRIVRQKGLAPLDPADYPVADIPPELQLSEYQQFDGKVYGISEKFGFNATAYNSLNVTDEEARNQDVFWNPKLKGKIAVYDYYLPIIARVALTLGIKPQDLKMEDLPKIREKLFSMKENIAIISDITTSQVALASGSVDILAGGGEYAVAGMIKEKPHLNWVLPDTGALRWQQSIAMVAGTKNEEGAKKFIQYILSPEGQARLATSSCYWGMPANAKATLTEEQKKVLRWDDQPGFLANSYPYPAPSPELDKAMRDLWAEFRAH